MFFITGGSEHQAICFRPFDGRDRKPHLRTWRDGWRFMRLHALRWLLLYPGLAMSLTALAGSFILLTSPVQIGGATSSTNTLMVTQAGLLVGFQIVVLTCCAEVFSRRHGILPPGGALDRCLMRAPFEYGIMAGGTLLLGGIICLFFALLEWNAVGFGDLPGPGGMRLVFVGVTVIFLGIQIILAGFVLAAHGLEGGGETTVRWTTLENPRRGGEKMKGSTSLIKAKSQRSRRGEP